MKERCQSCALQFEREPGYWVGATIINTTVIFATFVVVFVGGVMTTWPNVPWTPFLIVLLVVNGLIPVLFYPLSKTIWSAMEMGWNPLDSDELSGGDVRP